MVFHSGCQFCHVAVSFFRGLVAWVPIFAFGPLQVVMIGFYPVACLFRELGYWFLPPFLCGHVLCGLLLLNDLRPEVGLAELDVAIAVCCITLSRK